MSGSAWGRKVRAMKKIFLLAAVSATGLLASCGGGTNTGDASASISQLKTEYRDSNGRYVACDTLFDRGVSISNKTQVGVYFTAQGTVQSVDIGLRGNSSTGYDGNYNTTASGTQLANIGGNNFKVIFDADAAQYLLPQSITVNPTARYIKNVAVSNNVGSFHADLTLNSATGTGTATSRYLGTPGNIPVYSSCSLISTTTETL